MTVRAIIDAIFGPRDAAGPEPAERFDVAAHLDALAAKADQKLDWRHSVVDLMKLLGLDSGFDARKELAHDLDYPGPVGGSGMNVWLHRELMRRVFLKGGKVPEELL